MNDTLAKVKHISIFILSRVIACLIMFYGLKYTPSYLDFEVPMVYQIVLIIIAGIWPLWVYTICEMLIYWVCTMYVARKYFTSDNQLLFCGVVVTTLAKSIGVIGLLKTAIGYIIGTTLNIIVSGL